MLKCVFFSTVLYAILSEFRSEIKHQHQKKWKMFQLKSGKWSAMSFNILILSELIREKGIGQGMPNSSSKFLFAKLWLWYLVNCKGVFLKLFTKNNLYSQTAIYRILSNIRKNSHIKNTHSDFLHWVGVLSHRSDHPWDNFFSGKEWLRTYIPVKIMCTSGQQ